MDADNADDNNDIGILLFKFNKKVFHSDNMILKTYYCINIIYSYNIKCASILYIYFLHNSYYILKKSQLGLSFIDINIHYIKYLPNKSLYKFHQSLNKYQSLTNRMYKT